MPITNGVGCGVSINTKTASKLLKQKEENLLEKNNFSTIRVQEFLNNTLKNLEDKKTRASRK